MNARITSTLPAFGAQIEGGLFHGIYLLNGQLWGEVTAPKAEGEIADLPWMAKHVDVPGASHDYDGLANTIAMAEAGSALGKAARALRIDGHDDWYIPARGGQLAQWSNLRFLLGEAEAFEPRWYWSSTQFDRYYAYYQYFDYGYTYYRFKSWESGRARVVRRFLIQ